MKKSGYSSCFFMSQKSAPLITYLETLEDVRRAASCDHNFIDILVISVCAILANADTWEDIQSV
ncbi:transposase family protein [Sansalvadorimonas verongulae]|nr:transposase family protein [Sansalvadorimonas verongulae]